MIAKTTLLCSVQPITCCKLTYKSVTKSIDDDVLKLATEALFFYLHKVNKDHVMHM